jgi:cell division septation protein DedD
MPLDYRPKRQVTKNRPRKRPVKLMLLLILGSVFSVYGLGVATGWLIFKYFPQDTPAPSASSLPTSGADQQMSPSPAPASAKRVAAVEENDPDLTFYYTLPKGKTGVMGSGMNTFPPVAQKSAPSATAQAQTVKTVQQPPQATEKKEVPTPPAQSESKSSDKGTYTVQVAAYHNESEAQELKAKLLKIGLSVRIEKYTVSGKGIWYRVRTGRGLDRDSANRLAAKIGTNAMVIPE